MASVSTVTMGNVPRIGLEFQFGNRHTFSLIYKVEEVSGSFFFRKGRNKKCVDYAYTLSITERVVGFNLRKNKREY